MSVHVLIISHHAIGNAIVSAASTTFGDKLPLPTSAVEIPPDCDPDTTTPKLIELVEKVDQGDGVLILTDLYGSTPCNIAYKILKDHNVEVVTGLNLPMLLRVLNYPDLNLAELGEKAQSGGHEGITTSEDIDKDD